MTPHRLTVLAAFLTAALPAAAGPLDPPPGPITPTNKTLVEVEPRIAINAVNTPGDADSVYRIAQAGSYYLTGNITGAIGKSGIEIADGVEGVTIDLMGFSVLGVGGSLHGVRAESSLTVTVRNGRLAYWGADGVHLVGNSIVVEDIAADLCQGWGVWLHSSYPGNRIARVLTGQNTLGGINAGQLCLVDHCQVYYSQTGPGISASITSRVENCAVWNCNPGVQITGQGSIVSDTTTYFCTVGIALTSTDSIAERNIVRTLASQVGLRTTAAGNSITDNTVVGAGTRYDLAAGTHARLLLTQLPETISWPAEVTLAGSLTGAPSQNGLTIAADDVTVDLGGHDLIGVAGSLDAINVSGTRKNITVRNGSVRSWTGDGVDTSAATSSVVESVQSTDNTGVGIRTGERSVVRKCVTRSNVSDNISLGQNSQAIDCLADASTGGHGINATGAQSLVRGCTASGNALSGVRAGTRALVQGCTCSNNTLHGVHITFAGVVEDCFINGNSGDGVLMDAGGAVSIRNNTISESSGTGDTGIRVLNAGGCHIEGNHISFCTTGILINTSGNVVVRNSSLFATTPFSIVAGNTAGPVISPGGAAAATNPLANLTN